MFIKDSKSRETAGSRNSNEPRRVGQILSERLANGIDAFALACRQHLINLRKEVAAL